MSTRLENFKLICETISIMHPDMPMSEAFPLALEVEAKAETMKPKPPAPPSRLAGPAVFSAYMEELTNFIDECPKVVAYIKAGNQKIHAIKELRAEALCGLKEAKDAVEAYETKHGYTSTSPF